jgi:hypothetical protein
VKLLVFGKYTGQTLTTVGYGDIFTCRTFRPSYSLFCNDLLLGYGIIAVPTGIMITKGRGK